MEYYKLEDFPKTITTGELAAVLGLSTERVRQLGNEGVLVKTAHGEYAFVASCQGYFRYLRKLTYGPAAAEIMEDYIVEIRKLQARIEALEAKAAK